MRGLAAVVLCAVLAGCSQAPAADEAPVQSTRIDGWVVDETLRPVAGANVSLAGLGAHALTQGDGHFVVDAPAAADLLVTVRADGFVPASRSLGAFGGVAQTVNFTLERVPVDLPYTVVQTFTGFLRCGAVVVALEDQGRPHEHQGLRCSTVLEDSRNQWHTTIPTNTTGMILEVEWEPGTPFSTALVMKVVVDGTQEVLGFIEGPSILRLQLSQVKLEQNRVAGHPEFTVTLEAGAGTGDHEHGSVGTFYEQAFTVYATSFYNGPVDSSYSISDGR